ncbi:MAG: S-layer homology domain-containing protein [Clostridia bacterium]|nr:S-layer homology domain-containing protein [Clostridia bacterium]
MKNKCKKWLALGVSLAMLLPAVVSAKGKTTSAEYYDDADYLLIDMQSTAVTRDIEKNEIIFQNSDTEDTSIYIIDEKTLLPEDAATASVYIEGFVSGSYPWIQFFVPISKYYEYSKKQNEEIRIPAIFVFSAEIYKYGGDDRDPIEEEFSFLEIFGIIEGNESGKVNLDIPVSRADMAQIVLNMLNLKNTPAFGMQPGETFTDVPEEHPAFNAAHLAMQMGHVSGYGDGTFRPEVHITNEQAVKMLVSMLGYAPRAGERGGYPDGYWSVAEEIGLLENTTLERTAEATQGQIARLLMNAVYLPVMEQTVYSNNPVYTVMDGVDGALMRFFDKYLSQPHLER